MNKEIKPTFEMPFGDYTASLVNGSWIYKSNGSSALPTSQKTVGKYKDPVQVKVMGEYEILAEDAYKKQLSKMCLDIVKFLKMQLSVNQLNELLEIIERNQAFVIAKEFGVDFLTDEDKERLKDHGIDIDSLYSLELDTIYTSFNLGMLSEALGIVDTNKVTYEQLRSYVVSGDYIPLTQREKEVIQNIKMQSFNDVKALNGKIFRDVNQVLLDDTLESQKDFLREEIEEGTKRKKSVSMIAHKIAEKTGDWSRNFDRIVEYASSSAYEYGKAEMIERSYGADALVWKRVYNSACSHCIRLYLTNGLGSEPIVFKLSDLKANGTNIGRKTAEWKAVVGSTHPHCFDKETEVLTSEGWKLFKDLNMNEKFMSMNPETKEIEWVKAVDKVNYHYKGWMHSFKGFSFDLLTTPNHKHFIHSPKTKMNFLCDGNDLKSSYRFIRNIGHWNNEDKYLTTIGSTIFKTIDFAKFMGWWLSEGSISKPKRGKWQLSISQEKTKNLAEIKEVCERMFDKVWCGKGKFYIPLEDEGLVDYFLKFGYSYEKYVPIEIKELGIDYLEAFLLCYVKGDGSQSIKSNNYIKNAVQTVIHTSSKKLAGDLSEIIIKLGAIPSYRITVPKEIKHRNGIYTSKHLLYTVRICKTKNTLLSKLEKQNVMV